MLCFIIQHKTKPYLLCSKRTVTGQNRDYATFSVSVSVYRINKFWIITAASRVQSQPSFV
jgi:hypothetical protein